MLAGGGCDWLVARRAYRLCMAVFEDNLPRKKDAGFVSAKALTNPLVCESRRIIEVAA